MPHGHGVDNFSLRFCRKSSQLDLGESRSPTQIFQRNLQPSSHRFWAYVCAFGLGLIVMMAMAMAMVPEALKQGGGYVNANVNVKVSTDLSLCR